jgi:hypothetical protein
MTVRVIEINAAAAVVAIDLAQSHPAGGPFLGIAVLNWLSRNAEPSTLRVVMLAKIVGFGAVTATTSIDDACSSTIKRYRHPVQDVGRPPVGEGQHAAILRQVRRITVRQDAHAVRRHDRRRRSRECEGTGRISTADLKVGAKQTFVETLVAPRAIAISAAR